MIFGVGIDIEDHLRFKKFIQPNIRQDNLLPIYSSEEIKNYQTYNNHLCLAISFCCKEAFFKAFGVSWTNSKMQWKDIEILFLSSPEKKLAKVHFSGYAQELIELNHIITPATFTYTINSSSIIFEAILECSNK